MSAARSTEPVRYAFRYRRREKGFEVWRWEGSAGENLSACGLGYPATLDLARASARQHAFRSGVPFAEMEKKKREPKAPPLTDMQRDAQRIRVLDGLAQQSFEKDPGRAAGIWLSSAQGLMLHAKLYRPDRARQCARSALLRLKHAETCIAKWREELEAIQPERRLRLVAAPRGGEGEPTP